MVMIELSNLNEIVALRRDIHAHPELAYDEHRTAQLVADRLRAWGIETHTGIGGTGVVGVLKAGAGDRAILLRADMDALPIQEENTFAHRSRHDGKMHGCGHDGHTAMLLAAAHHLKQAGGFNGTVYAVFQPAEENGGAGARAMMQDGLFERFPCEAVFGLHNWPGLPAGTFGVASGPFMAAANAFRITVTGRGGHSSAPQDCDDPVPAMLAIGQALQTILTRSKRPLDAAVLSITKIQIGGEVTNIISGEGYLQGSVRAYSTDTVDLIERRMHEIAGPIAAAHNCRAEVYFERRYPALVNTPAETAFCLDVVRDMAGEDHARTIDPAMSSEDFAYMLQAKPGCYIFLGNGEGGHRLAGHGLGPCMLHNTSYDFNDDLIPVGASYWVRLVQKYLA